MNATTYTPLPRRSIGGAKGGRPLTHDYWFAPRDGDHYPSESTSIQRTRIEAEPTEQDPSGWQWALAHARLTNLWLVIPLHAKDTLGQREETNKVRSSVSRSARRLGLSLISQRLGDHLYVFPQDRE